MGNRDRYHPRQVIVAAVVRSGQTPPANALSIRLGLRANLAQFSLLVTVNALVGATLGQERTVVPLLARDTFHLSGLTVALTFIVAFGTTKAITNFPPARSPTGSAGSRY